MISQDLENKISKGEIPDLPGIYEFVDNNGTVLYVGKATSLRDRTRSYFKSDLIETRGRRIVEMVVLATNIKVTATLSVLEALILEAAKIKELQPKYNVIQKDNKSFNFVIISKEKFPKIYTVREQTMKMTVPANRIKYSFGPFTSGTALREALKIIRKMFPYRDENCTPAEYLIKEGKKPKRCFNRHIGLCPGVCTGEISSKDYLKTIKHIKLFFEGKKVLLIKTLEKEMNLSAKDQKFETANQLKKTIFALDHINDIALIKKDNEEREQAPDIVYEIDGFSSKDRIEAYDIAHLAGKNTVGVMVVIENGELNKNEYRKFKIRGGGVKSGLSKRVNVEINDIENLKEVLTRRLNHSEWLLPKIIVVDGSTAQINAAKEVINEKGLSIDIISVVKDDRHKAKDLIGDKSLIEKYGNQCLLANNEAHRFAIHYHRHLRSKIFGR